jgi:hypothetical protein
LGLRINQAHSDCALPWLQRFDGLHQRTNFGDKARTISNLTSDSHLGANAASKLFFSGVEWCSV